LEQKQAVVAEVAKQVSGAQAIVMVENRGMPVADMTRLRAKARASGVYFRVVKNTLVRRAVAETPFAQLADRMVGPLAYGIGPDPVAVAKVLNDFAKGNEKFVITGGAMPGQVMSAKDIAALAALPPREELIAKLLGTMQAPIAGFARTLSAVPSKFVRTLAAVRDAKAAA
jgi:large subunit ribosomal protein L10